MDKPPVAILAGGRGTRLSEETNLIPKPMVEIGGKPILWHIMKIYAHYGFKEFVIALGYKGEIIKDYFLHYEYTSASHMEIDLRKGGQYHSECVEDWIIHLLDTGEESQISGRVRRIMELTKTTTMLTYGDGLANIDIQQLLDFHRSQKRFATITAVHPPSRFGRLQLSNDKECVTAFDEKPLNDEWINGGFMVLEPDILTYGPYRDNENFERMYLPRFAEERELSSYVHKGFWQCMDTIREKQILNSLWETGSAPWKVWND